MFAPPLAARPPRPRSWRGPAWANHRTGRARSVAGPATNRETHSSADVRAVCGGVARDLAL